MRRIRALSESTSQGSCDGPSRIYPDDVTADDSQLHDRVCAAAAGGWEFGAGTVKYEPQLDPPGAVWKAFVRLDASPVRLVMRRKINDRWEYREPTQQEVEEYNDDTAW